MLRTRIVGLVGALLAGLLLAPPASAGNAGNSAVTRTLRPLHVVRGGHGVARIADDTGKQVLLRGANVNQLGDYYQDDPNLPTTFPLTERDFQRMSALGFNVVRLVLSWSALEPEPGVYSEDYLARIEQAVAWAKQHDMYVVLDMHQDAWGKYVATPDGAHCLPGATPAIGWDGAPEWATYTDGFNTCKYEQREASPAVQQAFTNFWLDRPAPDGVSIQQHLVEAWGWLAGKFATEPAVAGYDLFNEPSPGYLGPVTGIALLGRYYDRAIEEIRAAESAAGGFAHIVFFEPSIVWSALSVGPPVQPAFTSDDNVVFAPHIYAGTIAVGPITVEQAFAAAEAAAGLYRSTFWVGEWGAASVGADPEPIARFAEQQDQYLVGGTWWVWRQACGDPHMIRDPGSEPRPISNSLIRYRCPEGTPFGISDPIRTILSRPYPRAAPGRITQLESDGAAVTMTLRGSTATPGRLDIWVPGEHEPTVDGSNITDVAIRPVDGGYRVHATAHGDYRVELHD